MSLYIGAYLFYSGGGDFQKQGGAYNGVAKWENKGVCMYLKLKFSG